MLNKKWTFKTESEWEELFLQLARQLKGPRIREQLISQAEAMLHGQEALLEDIRRNRVVLIEGVRK